MARTNLLETSPKPTTHGGAIAARITPEQELRRSVMSCMLWEDTFYEDGVSIADRIKDLVTKVDPTKTALIASQARNRMNLRHIPLLLARELVRRGEDVSDLLADIVQRPDELSEFLSLYWKDDKCPLDHSVRRGLSAALAQFDAYQLAKYDRRSDKVKLRDVLRIIRPKPKMEEQAALWGKLVHGDLEAPDTWEAALTTGKDKKETWERLIAERKLGAMALLRNLKGMLEVHVDEASIREALRSIRGHRILPFRFIAAAKAAPRFEREIEVGMLRSLEGQEKLLGSTTLLVDVSGSMNSAISAKSDLQRLDAACGLAIFLAGICETLRVFTFSNALVEVPPRQGMALRDAIVGSQPHSGTYLGQAVDATLNTAQRLIVISDEQSHDRVNNPSGRGYMVNVASYQNGVGYGKWTHIDGWSEAIVDFIRESEWESLN